MWIEYQSQSLPCSLLTLSQIIAFISVGISTLSSSGILKRERLKDVFGYRGIDVHAWWEVSLWVLLAPVFLTYYCVHSFGPWEGAHMERQMRQKCLRDTKNPLWLSDVSLKCLSQVIIVHMFTFGRLLNYMSDCLRSLLCPHCLQKMAHEILRGPISPDNC